MNRMKRNIILKIANNSLISMVCELIHAQNVGGRLMITIPKRFSNQLGIKEGDYLSVSPDKDSNTLRVTPTGYSKYDPEDKRKNPES